MRVHVFGDPKGNRPGDSLVGRDTPGQSGQDANASGQRSLYGEEVGEFRLDGVDFAHFLANRVFVDLNLVIILAA